MTHDELARLHAYWRAANYLAVGQIYLLDNPLLREPLRVEHVKPRLLGHWGVFTFIYPSSSYCSNRVACSSRTLT
jgi:xylulose-5-phosphate/fructose-6-phosphate phosphoketolase